MLQTPRFILKDDCLLCSKKFSWNEVIIVKAPEGACFCMECIDKFEDNNKYEGKNAWIVHEFRGKEEFIYESSGINHNA